MALAESRLNHCETNGVKSQLINAKFAKRRSEIEILTRLTNKIKEYIKKNKKELLKERNEVDRQIFAIKVENDAKLKETLQRKSSKSSMFKSSASESAFSDTQSV